LGEVPTFHGAASQTPNRGIPARGFLGYYLWSPIVSPLFVSGFTGRVKSRPVSAFVGVKGEDIRWSRLPKAPGQASRGVCKFAGRPPACPAGSRTHPVPVSHTQPYSVHAQSTYVATYVVPHARGHRGVRGVQRRTG